jgi:hypothetical protein
MKIIYVKKIKADGSPCKKCAEVTERLEKTDQMQFINDVLIADERDPGSPGMLIARELAVERAPFFVVEQDDGTKDVYTVYFKFVKEVLNQAGNDKEALKDILDQNDDLDYI